jgi:hypothetical protein
MPIVGSFAGASARAYGAGAGLALLGDYESIATISVGAGGAANPEFTSIPSTYTHLQIRGISKNPYTSVDYPYIQFNSDSANNYTIHTLQGNGSSASVQSYAPTSGVYVIASGTNSSDVFSPLVIDILDYANTNKFKTVRSISGYDASGVGIVGLFSGVWRSTNAITSIKFLGPVSFSQYSSFALYGVKA